MNWKQQVCVFVEGFQRAASSCFASDKSKMWHKKTHRACYFAPLPWNWRVRRDCREHFQDGVLFHAGKCRRWRDKGKHGDQWRSGHRDLVRKESDSSSCPLVQVKSSPHWTTFNKTLQFLMIPLRIPLWIQTLRRFSHFLQVLRFQQGFSNNNPENDCDFSHMTPRFNMTPSFKSSCKSANFTQVCTKSAVWDQTKMGWISSLDR